MQIGVLPLSQNRPLSTTDCTEIEKCSNFSYTLSQNTRVESLPFSTKLFLVIKNFNLILE